MFEVFLPLFVISFFIAFHPLIEVFLGASACFQPDDTLGQDPSTSENALNSPFSLLSNPLPPLVDSMSRRNNFLSNSPLLAYPRIFGATVWTLSHPARAIRTFEGTYHNLFPPPRSAIRGRACSLPLKTPPPSFVGLGSSFPGRFRFPPLLQADAEIIQSLSFLLCCRAPSAKPYTPFPQ